MGTPGEVYILHNCGLREGLIKIGVTRRTAEARAAELMTSGVPEHFIVLFSWHVDNADEVERRLHSRFAEYRYNDRREFFHVAPSRAIYALLEEAGTVNRVPTSNRDDVDALPLLHSTYGSLLDPNLIAVTLEMGDRSPTSLVCHLDSFGDQIVLRRDMDFVSSSQGLYFAPAKDVPDAVRLLLALGPYSLIVTTPLFSDQGGQLIADLSERLRLDDQQIIEILTDARVSKDSIDVVEARIRTEHDLPAHGIDAVTVQEHAGRFLLSLRRGVQPLHNLQIEDDGDEASAEEPVSVVIVMRPTVEELCFGDVVEVGRRSSPMTWTGDGPRLRVAGLTSTGIPFEQFFSFLP